MNKECRKRVDESICKIEELKLEIEEIFEEVIVDRDNILENSQKSERCERTDINCDNLQSAINSLEEATLYLGSCQ